MGSTKQHFARPETRSCVALHKLPDGTPFIRFTRDCYLPQSAPTMLKGVASRGKSSRHAPKNDQVSLATAMGSFCAMCACDGLRAYI